MVYNKSKFLCDPGSHISLHHTGAQPILRQSFKLNLILHSRDGYHSIIQNIERYTPLEGLRKVY